MEKKGVSRCMGAFDDIGALSVAEMRERITELCETNIPSVWTPDEKLLTPNRILYTIGLAKAKFATLTKEKKIDHITCYMTPLVKEYFLTAYNKLRWFGKPMPTVVQYDEWGRTLPNAPLLVARGVTIKMCDPETYGSVYLQFHTIYK